MTDLHDLKAGDKVAYASRWGRTWGTETIERVTPSQIICGHRRYSRKTGKEIGSDNYRARVVVSTDHPAYVAWKAANVASV